ncbi:MAG: hypothetical protein HY599_03140 [Candidatus Omnitrophica bacterium]|nr:hypothetical protein [Candidatus Omnitrophota bacterium]
MSWLSKLLGYVSKPERAGISLNRKEPYWVMKSFSDFPAFLRCLAHLFPEGSVLYLEGTSIGKEVQEFLKARAPEKVTRVELGTIWPRPQTFHMLLTAENITELAALAEKHALPELCDHLHVYKDSTVLLEAHDILDRCISLSGALPKERIETLCGQLGAEYKKGEGGCFCSPGKYR